MSETTTPVPSAPPPPATAAVVAALIASAARWFWWIAGLSLVNTIMVQSGSTMNFVVGLGITAVADVFFADAKMTGFIIDAVAIGFFVLVGWQGQRGKLWAFYLGIVVYALDALVYVSFQDWMPVAFHGLAIYFLAKGAMLLRATKHAVS
jgi:hypothetical protein